MIRENKFDDQHRFEIRGLSAASFPSDNTYRALSVSAIKSETLRATFCSTWYYMYCKWWKEINVIVDSIKGF